MFLQLQQQSLLIGRRPAGFTEHYYTEWDDGLGKEKISLFLVLSVGSSQVPGADIGKEAFQLLQDHFLDDLSSDPYDRFENALREINLMVQEKEKELDLKFIPNMHVICGVIQRDMLFLSQRGDAQGYLVRQRHVSSITDGLYDEKNKEDLFQNIASGVLEVGDSVVIVTGPLVQYVTPNDLSKIFSEQTLDEAGKELKDLLHSDVEEQMALLAFEILEKAEELIAVTEVTEEVEKMPEPELDKEATKKRWINAIGILRDWASQKEMLGFIDKIKQMERKRLLTMIGGLAIVIVLGLVILNFATSKQRQLGDMQGNLDIAEENITQAETRGTFDKEEASKLLDEAEDLAIEVLNSGYLGGQASQLLDRVEEQRDYLDNVVRIDDELTELVDFTELLGTASIVGVVPYNENYIVYTPNEAYSVLIDQVQSPVTIDSTERIIAADYFADRDNVVMLAASGNVIEYTDGNAQFADTSDVEWNGGVDVVSYSSKIYVLDPDNEQIWKYNRGTISYGGAQAYLTGVSVEVDEEAVDLGDAVSMAIDGNVWVLLSDGTLAQYLSGELLDYTVNKAPMTSLEGATKVYTELEINQLYILDPINERILIYNKSSKTDDLTYSSQYVFSGLKGVIQDIYVDKTRDVVIIATDRALYELGF